MNVAVKAAPRGQKVNNFNAANFRNAIIAIGVKARGFRIKDYLSYAVHFGPLKSIRP